MNAAVKGAMARHSMLRLLAHDVCAGRSAAIRTGVLAARGAVKATLDGDGQNPPEEFPKFSRPLLAGGTGLVAERQDTWPKRAASQLANVIRGRMLGDGTRDTGCGLKACRRGDFRREDLSMMLVDVRRRSRPGGRALLEPPARHGGGGGPDVRDVAAAAQPSGPPRHCARGSPVGGCRRGSGSSSLSATSGSSMSRGVTATRRTEALALVAAITCCWR